ncbi:MAG: DUF3822 family protein [Prevotellaceae bacterium]|jgi:hypothetical protein|nr:DUF3822 family protein [Prevotellaceae bacterium]
MLLSDNKTQNTDSKYNHTLSIRFYPDGFYFFVADKSNTVLTKEDVFIAGFEQLATDAIVRLLNKNISVSEQVHTAVLVYESSKYCFAPSHFVKNENDRLFFSFYEKKNQPQVFLHTGFPFWKNELIYAVPKSIADAVSQLFPQTEIAHPFNVLLEEKNLPQNNTLYLWKNKKTIDALLVKSKNLLLANGFPYNTNEDITYHILHLYEQMKLDVESFPLKFFSPDKKGLLEMLGKYIHRCE